MTGKYIKRNIEPTITEAAKYFPVVTLTGPRQSGKTTTLKHLFPHLRYYSLEDPATRQLADSDPVAFLHRHEEGMMLDEVHHAPHLLSYIQGIVDDAPQKRFVLSGSSNFALLKNITQSLAGRSGVYELLPVSLDELGTQGSESDLDRLLFDGLYPAVCSGKNLARLLYPAYVKTYLERDVHDLINVKDMRLFNIFLRLCAGRIGSIYNASEMANEVGVSPKTIQAWTSILEASYVLFLLPPYHENMGKRLTKSPKLYMCDTGLACSLLGMESADQLAYDRMRGHLFENLIVMEMVKRRLNKGLSSNLYFYRDSNGNEIDIVADSAAGLQLFEVKSAATFNSSFSKTLERADGWFRKPITSRTVVYTGDLENPEGKVRLVNFRHL